MSSCRFLPRTLYTYLFNFLMGPALVGPLWTTQKYKCSESMLRAFVLRQGLDMQKHLQGLSTV